MSNAKALEDYDIKKYRTPDGYTSDIAVFTIVTSEKEEYKPPVMALKLMLIQRSAKDSEGRLNIEALKWALPGGFVADNESAYESAKRELEEETSVSGIHIQHFGVYDKPGRDPRGWIISNAHYAIVPEKDLIHRKANDDAMNVELFGIDEVFALDLAFDHRQIIHDAVKMISRDLLQTTISRKFLPELFTYSELQAVLKTVTDDLSIAHTKAFQRKIKTFPFIEEVPGQVTNRTSKKPTKLYRFNETEVTNNIFTAVY